MVSPLNDGDNNDRTAVGSEVAQTPTNIPSNSSTSSKKGAKVNTSAFPQVKFSHIQIYADSLDDLDVYKKLENDLCEFSVALEWQEKKNNKVMDQKGKRQLWQSILSKGSSDQDFQEFLPQNRDVIKQLIVGFGMRVTATHRGCGTKSFLVTTNDLGGVQIVVTAKNSNDEVPCSDPDGHDIHHFETGMHHPCSWS
jgi:hypothetical protein